MLSDADQCAARDAMPDAHITILAGGVGSRLWPKSRLKTPKQLLALMGERSMLQQTMDRVLPLVPPERIYVLTGPDHAAAVAAQLPELSSENIFVEPSPRHTAPCLGLAAMRLRLANPGSDVMISLHADHTIVDADQFCRSLVEAAELARRGHLVTIGIVPSFPSTGFGYIERDAPLNEAGTAFDVVRFREKPPLEQARAYVESGRFYWNAGYFAWTLDTIENEFKQRLPTRHALLCQVAEAMAAGEATRARSAWERIEPVSIDVGIMEGADRVAVIPTDMGWNDIGSWASMHEVLPQDADRNVILGDGHYVGLDTTGSIISSSKRLIATVGLENMIVIDTPDALLVLPRDRAQQVSALVKALREQGLTEYL